MTDTNPKNPPVGVIDPATGQPHPNSGPSGGPAGAAAGTQARDVAGPGTAGASDGPSGSGQSTAGQAQEKAKDAAGAAQEKAQEAAGQAQEKAQQAAGQARTQIKDQLDQRSTQAGERATATAGDLRSISDQLRDQGNEAPAKLADNAALQIEKVGSYLQRTDGSSLLHDVETFARRNPWATALGGLAVGFAASRALKASSTDRHRASTSAASSSTPSPAPYTGTAPVGSSIPYPGTSATGGAAAPIPVGESPSRLGSADSTPPFPSVPGGTPGTRTTPTEAPDAVTTGYSVPSGAPGQPGTATNPTDSQTGS
jgi:hypothetical protein